MISPVHQVLREGTRERHETLDQGLALAEDHVDRGHYLAYLRALLGWLEPLEQRLWQLDWPQSLRARERAGKTVWLHEDLNAAGDAASIVHCEHSPQVAKADAYALGVAYVVEGSQLGGRFLAKRLQAVAPDLPQRYLHGYGDQVGPLWKEFLLYLDSEAGALGREAQALQGARDAFDSLTGWLRSQGALRA
ncbi:biliverdin-producing heme oxygenase [Achromobacter spanius]|uniref:Heme oxygenase n=1 Tax=Achromobacter spanius TaxID=217203 RepID=A0A2S0IBM5_9BURK|nr:biliverdin-producing heme oxygenase [Achromobacter spanius]AVJ29439.1 heme oxygenase [Achromobacter spanius]